MAHTGNAKHKQLVFTLKDQCRVCFTCVRECPVKAIKIINGQAEVLAERCIGCGNCINVCSQGAKIYLKQSDEVFQLLKKNKKVVAIVAPSFPAEFTEIKDFRILVGMIRALGFNLVCEVGFGADMVARQYRKLVGNRENKSLISSDCPAIVYYIKHYYPNLVNSLVPIASPMVAMSRVVREKYGKDCKIVFIGPCIAKKAESDEINSSITFTELREMFNEKGIKAQKNNLSEFDPPFAGKGAIFPVSRGLMQNMDIKEDICEGNIIVASGRVSFRDAVDEYDKGFLKSTQLELLCCEGCIMGPGMSKGGKKFSRRSILSNYVREKLEKLDENQWELDIQEFEKLDFSQTFEPSDRRISRPNSFEIARVLESMGKKTPSDNLNCGACGYDTCIEHAVAIVQGLAEEEMCLPFSIEKLHRSIIELNNTNVELASAKQALKQSEKLASMGQLSAGIAHELNNPLGVITMYSNILKEESRSDDPIRKDLELIAEQADRCKKIVSGLLNFARKNQIKLVEKNLGEFIKHSFESIILPENVNIKFINNLSNPNVFIDTDQMMQVLTNLFKNAVEAMPNGGTLTIEIYGVEKDVKILIRDTGTGISQENMDKIFTPFFTTKQPGKGTGLGLPLIYGIVKMHNGQIQVVSNDDPTKGETGTSFKITLPRKNEQQIIKDK